MAQKATDTTDAQFEAITLQKPTAMGTTNVPAGDDSPADRRTVTEPVTDYESQLSVGDTVRVTYDSSRSPDDLTRTGTVQRHRPHETRGDNRIQREHSIHGSSKVVAVDVDDGGRKLWLPTRQGEGVVLQQTGGSRITGTTLGGLVAVERVIE
jgi:hypothetical protein